MAPKRVCAFLELVGENIFFRLRGALHGRAVRSVPIPVTFQLHHDWGYLPDALAARLVQNPVGAARSPPLHADPHARTAAQTDSPARVHLAPDLPGKRKLSPRMHCWQQQKELHRLAPYGERLSRGSQGFSDASRSQRNYRNG